MNSQFLLEQLIVKHKSKVLCEVVFISEDNYQNKEPMTTAIIGTNGSGKSFILMTLAELFHVLDTGKNIASLKYDYYKVQYIYDEHKYSFEISSKVITCFIDEKSSDFNELILPTKVLGVSYMLNDKFRYKTPDNAIYQYCGIRQTSNASWTSSVSNKVADNLLDIFLNKSSNSVLSVTNFLGIDSKISILITPKAKTLFKRKKSVNELRKRIKGARDSYRQDKIRKITLEDEELIIGFLNDVKEQKLYSETTTGDTTFEFTIDVQSEDLLKENIRKYYKAIKLLNTLEYIKSISLCLYKNNDLFLFDYASSGEKHFIFEMSNILTYIEHHSLILIDEPEISMHPNWQLQYINTLKKIFWQYSDCHFIISTHSHFIVSDLDNSSSSLISLDYNSKTKERIAQLIQYSTYAWSAENILYNIFKMRTTRNWYFEQDVAKLANYIETKSKDENGILSLVTKLENYKLSQNDPLVSLIEEGKEYVKLLKQIEPDS